MKKRIYEWLAIQCVVYLSVKSFYKPARFFMKLAARETGPNPVKPFARGKKGKP